MIDLRRGDVVLVAFPFLREGDVHRKRRPAVVIQADRYNRRRGALILAAITSSTKSAGLPSKVVVGMESAEGRRAGLRTDSVVDGQTLITIPRTEVLARLGSFPAETMARIDRALADSLGLPPPAVRR
ncbi:MAG: type II toxin-antitoxin system PemK/MazF family toxin [Planctomycetes bacterium]|jgi:mRNA-degrading endonuclease toxin of MazEF toxin-antitoxin module|nr:type II toxin-antitoxin system PemK/MazF family toxin [Planctomycetota bacterium]